MSNIKFELNYQSKRSFGWCQDASDFTSLKKVVQIFDERSNFHEYLTLDKIPELIDDKNLVARFQKILNTYPVKICYSDLVGKHETPRKNSPCSGIIQASIRGQKKQYLTDWASDSFLRWAHLCGFIDYSYDDDTFKISNEGLEFSKTVDNSKEEKECLINALLKYPPVSRILELLSDGSHLSKFEIGSKLGFVGEEGFTTLPQNILLSSLAICDDSMSKNKMKSDWDGSSDKYARQICSWLINLGLLKQAPKEYIVNVSGCEYKEILSQSYMITPEGLKAYRRIRGVNKVSKVIKNVYYEMLCPKASDRNYIRTRRAYIIKCLSDSNKAISLSSIQNKLIEVNYNDSIDTIKDDIIGLINIGLFIKETPNGYILNDNIDKLIIPINSINNKSNILKYKDFCRDMLEHVPHNYLNLIDLAYSSKLNKQFEMEVIDLFVTVCGYNGLHLGGSRKPDGIIYAENYGAIIDTKAYSKGYSLPINQADEMKRYITENIKRDKKINANEWWNNFPKSISKFCYIFISSEFTGKIDDKLKNIFDVTSVNGSVINVMNLLILAENIKAEYIKLDEVYNLFASNSEIKFIPVDEE